MLPLPFLLGGGDGRSKSAAIWRGRIFFFGTALSIIYILPLMTKSITQAKVSWNTSFYFDSDPEVVSYEMGNNITMRSAEMQNVRFRNMVAEQVHLV